MAPEVMVAAAAAKAHWKMNPFQSEKPPFALFLARRRSRRR